MPVTFTFRGCYTNKNAIWEKQSSPAIMLTNSASKWSEKAFVTLALVRKGYDAKAISKAVCYIYIFNNILFCIIFIFPFLFRMLLLDGMIF